MAHALILLLNLLKCFMKFFLHFSGTREAFLDRMKALSLTVSIVGRFQFSKDCSEGNNDFDLETGINGNNRDVWT
jgi:hypothetical protein